MSQVAAMAYTTQSEPALVFRWQPGEKRVFVYWPDQDDPCTSFSVWDYAKHQPRIRSRAEFVRASQDWYERNRQDAHLLRTDRIGSSVARRW